jgi:hypothetical protein
MKNNNSKHYILLTFLFCSFITKGQEVIDKGADYGGFIESDFETGDGFDYSGEMIE